MTLTACSLLATLQDDEDLSFTIEDYAGAMPRWCPGCGDHAILTATQKLLEAEQLRPEQTVFVSGIGCSSRFPHYLSTYGFHGIHGRALPLATGIKMRNPSLHVFAVMGDGDCCSIGAGHWIHATRYNTNMVALMLDNGVYGLTKNQTSPTTPRGHPTNTQPRGSHLEALDPLSATLGVTNASFVAQTADWAPGHLYETLRAAFRHRGFAFVRVLQRCPQYTKGLFAEAVSHPDLVEVLVHERGITVPGLEKLYRRQTRHDPADLDEARRLARLGGVRLGVFYRNEDLPCYDEVLRIARLTAEEKVRLMDEELDRYAV
jgi:2-oxoglutarate ferredoxin oxidoreductase subunit beta